MERSGRYRSIDTFSKNLIDRLCRAKEKYPEHYRVDAPDRYGGVCAEVPKELLQITFRKPIGEERRKQMAQTAKELFFPKDDKGVLEE